jgi:hypothetical protein
LRGICDRTRSQTHDTIADLEPLRSALSNSAHDSNDVFAENSG